MDEKIERALRHLSMFIEHDRYNHLDTIRHELAVQEEMVEEAEQALLNMGDYIFDMGDSMSTLRVCPMRRKMGNNCNKCSSEYYTHIRLHRKYCARMIADHFGYIRFRNRTLAEEKVK